MRAPTHNSNNTGLFKQKQRPQRESKEDIFTTQDGPDAVSDFERRQVLSKNKE
jgi:hypothetical protein